MAQSLFIYILKVTVCSGVFMLYYWFSLRNKRFHYYNRFYLLASVVLSITLPLLHLQLFNFNSKSTQTIHLFNIINAQGAEDIILGNSNQLNYQQWLLMAGACISVLMMIMLCISIIKIYFIKKKFAVNKTPDFDFVNTDIQQAPFSFLKNIFWRNDISLEEETGKQILQHEITHIKQKHSWDKLFIQITLCFYWINPFFWLAKKELFLIHEFIADEKAIEKKDASAFAKMLLTSQYGKFQFFPAQSIFYSPIKRRLIMLTTSNKSQFSYVRRLMILPLLAFVVLLFSFTVKNENASSIIKSSAPFKLVVDAGHGGKDYGALGNGLYEKDVVLKIAEKIKELSDQYGIDVVLTRNSDVFMTPQEKADFANAQNADAFVSLHTNAEPENENTGLSGVEIYVSKDNSQPTSSRILGSAILQSLQPDFKTPQALSTRNVGIWVLKGTNLPAILVECGYITNAGDAKMLEDDSKIELIARNILKGAVLYANNKNSISVKDIQQPSNDTTPASTPLYVVDGKITTKSEADKIDRSSIDAIYVLKGKDATDKYGDDGKNGVIEIKLKNNSEQGEKHEPAPPPPPPAPPTKPLTAPLKLNVAATPVITIDTVVANVNIEKPVVKKNITLVLTKPVIIRDTLKLEPAKDPTGN